MRRHPEAGLQATGLVDDDPHKRNLLIDGVAVLGEIDALPRLQRTHPFDQVVLAINAADGALVRRAAAARARHGRHPRWRRAHHAPA